MAFWGAPGVSLIAGGTAFFLAENVVLSHNRDFIIQRYGSETYHGVYNTLSTAATLSVLAGFLRNRRCGPLLWRPPASSARLAGAFALQAIGLVGASQILPKMQLPFAFTSDGSDTRVATSAASPSAAPASSTQSASSSRVRFAARCPFDFKAKDSPDGIHGLQRVTRHPLLWSLAFFGLGMSVGSPVPAVVAFGLAPTAMATLGAAHQDYRYRRNMGGSLTPEVDAVTSLLPFYALVLGRQSWQAFWDELKKVNAAAGLATAAALAVRRSKMLRTIA